MASSVEIATTPSADTPHTCLFLRNDRTQYIFGRVGEGTQRAFTSRKLPTFGTSNVFLSGHVNWEQNGGLVGYLLTAANSAMASLDAELENNERLIKKGKSPKPLSSQALFKVHAADNISHILAASRRFIFRQPLLLKVHEYRQNARDNDPVNIDPDYQDDYIKVWNVPSDGIQATSPLKRSRESSTEPGVQEGSSSPILKAGRVPSDPAFAQFVTESFVFNGVLENSLCLLRTTRGELGPDDVAFVKHESSFTRYIPSDTDSQDMTVWVYPTTKEWKEKEKEGKLPTQYLEHVALPKTSYSQTSMSYIVKTMDRRGKFNVAAASSYGVEKMDYKRLIAGESVQGKDGQTVTPEMVLGDTMPGKGFIVADIPGREFVDSFFRRPEWKDTRLMENIFQIYWILGSGLSTDPQVLKFIEDHREFRHIISSPETCPNMITHPGSAELQMKLHRIDPDRFSILDYNNRTQATAPSSSTVTYGRTGHNVQLMPKLTVNEKNISPFVDLAGASAEVSAAVLQLAEEGKAKASDHAFLAQVEETEKDIPSRDTEIICLGTGSSCPSKYRNVCGTLIRVPGIGSYLLDAGEGTNGQIRRLFGDDGAREIMRDLKCVVISHLHADHHLGAVTVIKEWYNQAVRDGNKANLAMVCNGPFRSFLEEVALVEDFGLHRLFFPSCTANPGAPDRPLATEEHFQGNDCGLKAVKRIPVNHCRRSMATELEFSSGLRIAWSGDCRPSSDFAQACRGTHLLIHECTFDDDMKSHASAKKHSSLSEALGVARQMEARRTLLTHFSQRYVKAKSVSGRLGGGSSEEQAVLMGHDFMRVKLGDFQKAACYMPAIDRLMEDLAS
ncbi:unnamed protein product [Clonostachys chloroleuca]|uniref:ribonuclease Z n=1 Tax=Clonostachys chloroleuca TaxID=1926264 RepID=A0AA35M3J7_9HYPO|nr:unnamed protein product [Clonostachys chloroleuca]